MQNILKYTSVLLCLAPLILISCKASENFSGSESVTVLKLRESYRDNVSFLLTNQSSESVQIESTEHFYIERKEAEQWKRVPFIPCQCGTPCKPATVNDLKPNESIEITWDLISRKCGNKEGMRPPVSTIEEMVSSGEFRMIFNVNRQKDGMRISPEKLSVYFFIKE